MSDIMTVILYLTVEVIGLALVLRAARRPADRRLGIAVVLALATLVTWTAGVHANPIRGREDDLIAANIWFAVIQTFVLVAFLAASTWRRRFATRK